jgi:hypothetical protein
VKEKHGDIEVTKNSKNNEFDGIHVTTFFRRGERDVRGFNAECLRGWAAQPQTGFVPLARGTVPHATAASSTFSRAHAPAGSHGADHIPQICRMSEKVAGPQRCFVTHFAAKNHDGFAIPG